MGCGSSTTSTAAPAPALAAITPVSVAGEPASAALVQRLLEAAAAGRLGECTRLLDSGVDCNGCGGSEAETALTAAARAGHNDLAQELIRRGADVNKQDKNGSTPLMAAAGCGHKETLALLLRNGAEVNRKNRDGATALHVLAKCSDSLDCARTLLAAGADPSIADNSGKTPMDAVSEEASDPSSAAPTGAEASVVSAAGAASREGNTGRCRPRPRPAATAPSVEMAPVDRSPSRPIETETESATPDSPRASTADEERLYKAAEVCSVAECTRLLDAGVAVDSGGGEYRETALCVAAYRGSTELARLLVQRGADVNKADREGHTPLRKAARVGNTEVAAFLIASGARVNDASKYDDTPLAGAAYWGHHEAVSLLIQNGARVNLVNNLFDTALHAAAGNGHAACVRLLLAAGADVTCANSKGQTPIDVARTEAIRSLLVSSNAGDSPEAAAPVQASSVGPPTTEGSRDGLRSKRASIGEASDGLVDQRASVVPTRDTCRS